MYTCPKSIRGNNSYLSSLLYLSEEKKNMMLNMVNEQKELVTIAPAKEGKWVDRHRDGRKTSIHWKS